MGKKIKDQNDVSELTEEYMDSYINYRPQKNLGGVPPRLYKESFTTT